MKKVTKSQGMGFMVLDTQCQVAPYFMWTLIIIISSSSILKNNKHMKNVDAAC